MPDQYDALLDRLDGVQHRGGDQADARCPAHPDNKASLSVARSGSGRVVVHCHAGCRWTDVLAAVGMEVTEMVAAPNLVREHTYTDADGLALYVVERYEPKAFKQRLADGTRRAPKPETRVLYNLPMVMRVHEQEVKSIWFTEGEHDADSLAVRGYAATTTLGGANKPWLPQYSEALAGLRVVIIADNDQPGRKWARAVANYLHPGSSTVVVTPPKGIKDVTDLLEAGYQVSDLLPLAETHGETFSAADYPIKQVEWLWPGRIPAHMFTLLEGDPGTGKSTMTMELIACLTTGRPLPAMPTRRAPVRVGLLSDEDNWSMVVVPRLQAAGADLHRVIHFRGIRDEDGYLAPYSLVALNTLRDDIRKVGVDVLVIDPLMAYLGTDLDTHRDQHVRSVLGPLVQMAEEDSVTILAVRHFTKGSLGGKAIYRGGGSIGFTGQARSILQTGEYPHQEEEAGRRPQGRYVLAVAKCNLAPLAPSLGYRIDTDERLDVSRIVWEELPVPVTAMELSSGTDSDEKTRPSREAADWLRTYVADTWVGSAYVWAPILAAARTDGIAKNTLERARGQVLRPVISGPGGRAATRWEPISPVSRGPGNGEMGKCLQDSQESQAARDDLARRLDPSGYDDEEDSPKPPVSDNAQSEPARPDEPISPFPHFLVLGESGEMGSAETQSSEPRQEVECSVCGATEGLVIEDGDARCRWHNPLVWTRPEPTQ